MAICAISSTLSKIMIILLKSGPGAKMARIYCHPSTWNGKSSRVIYCQKENTHFVIPRILSRCLKIPDMSPPSAFIGGLFVLLNSKSLPKIYSRALAYKHKSNSCNPNSPLVGPRFPHSRFAKVLYSV